MIATDLLKHLFDFLLLTGASAAQRAEVDAVYFARGYFQSKSASLFAKRLDPIELQHSTQQPISKIFEKKTKLKSVTRHDSSVSR